MSIDTSFCVSKPFHQWGMVTCFLTLYCIGHGLLTAQTLLPLLSVVWSVSHASGLVAMALLTRRYRALLGVWMILLAMCSGVLLSELLFKGFTWGIAKPYSLHSYSSIVLYGVLGAFCYVYKPKIQYQTNKFWVDVGRRAILLAPEDIVLVTAAKNYIEIVMRHMEGTGLLRCSMSEFAKTHPHLLRVHRSTLVNPLEIACVQQLPRGCLKLIMRSGAEVKVSASYCDGVLARSN